jgi:hypothetical protein
MYWVTALIGLAGVVIGGLITGGIDYFLEWRREERALRQAKRLVALELETLRVHLELLVEENKVPSRPALGQVGFFLATEAWDAHKNLLAALLSDQEWRFVSAPYDVLPAVKLLIGAAEPETPVNPAWRIPELIPMVEISRKTLTGEPLGEADLEALRSTKQDHRANPAER